MIYSLHVDFEKYPLLGTGAEYDLPSGKSNAAAIGIWQI
jgi:hypothetical protein